MSQPDRAPKIEHALRLRGLRVTGTGGATVVDDVSLDVGAEEIVGVVGESGSGKTTVALSLLGYARRGMVIAGGRLAINGKEADLLDPDAMRPLRGEIISYVPQDPGASLNPSRRIGDQIADILDAHAERGDHRQSVLAGFERVNLPATQDFARRYPHQLSGGQQQRVTISGAIVCEPPVVVLDEPTTGLDVVTQARILDELTRLRRERRLSMIYVSHDLAVVSTIADRIVVMYGGTIVESGPASVVLNSPRHPYTRGLVAAIPDHAIPRLPRGIGGAPLEGGDARPPGCLFAPRCSQRVDSCDANRPPFELVEGTHRVACFEHTRTPAVDLGERVTPRAVDKSTSRILAVEHLQAMHRSRSGNVVAAADVSLAIHAGECVALVGESGSGKSTIARCIAGLHEPSGGRILLDGAELAGKAKRRPRDARRRIQIIFQNPYESLNPRHRVLDSVARPAQVLRGMNPKQSATESARLLELVRLPARLGQKFPAELSGGERQRIAIARALAAEPDIMICDEITSALDVSVQAAVLELLSELREDLGTSLLFISHDLGVVAAIADHVLVLERGHICEEGPSGQILTHAEHAYTQQLLTSAPRLRVEA